MVGAAGNDYNEGCDFPADSDLVIAAGAHNSNFDDSQFSQYGDCIDVWAPGSSVLVGEPTSDSHYNVASGTSFSSPFTVGIISNYLMECAATNYHVPCTFVNIKNRLAHPSQTVEDPQGIKCEPNFECDGLLYQCGRPYC